MAIPQCHLGIKKSQGNRKVKETRTNRNILCSTVQDSTSPICYLAVSFLTSKSKKAERIAHPIRLVSSIHIRQGGYYIRDISQRYPGHGEFKADLQARNKNVDFDFLGFVESLHHSGSAHH